MCGMHMYTGMIMNMNRNIAHDARYTIPWLSQRGHERRARYGQGYDWISDKTEGGHDGAHLPVSGIACRAPILGRMTDAGAGRDRNGSYTDEGRGTTICTDGANGSLHDT